MPCFDSRQAIHDRQQGGSWQLSTSNIICPVALQLKGAVTSSDAEKGAKGDRSPSSSSRLLNCSPCRASPSDCDEIAACQHRVAWGAQLGSRTACTLAEPTAFKQVSSFKTSTCLGNACLCAGCPPLPPPPPSPPTSSGRYVQRRGGHSAGAYLWRRVALGAGQRQQVGGAAAAGHGLVPEACLAQDARRRVQPRRKRPQRVVAARLKVLQSAGTAQKSNSASSLPEI